MTRRRLAVTGGRLDLLARAKADQVRAAEAWLAMASIGRMTSQMAGLLTGQMAAKRLPTDANTLPKAPWAQHMSIGPAHVRHAI